MNLNTKDVLEGTDLHMMKVKIFEILKILGDFNLRREEGKARYEYVDELKELFTRYFGFSNDLPYAFIFMFYIILGFYFFI